MGSFNLKAEHFSDFVLTKQDIYIWDELWHNIKIILSQSHAVSFLCILSFLKYMYLKDSVAIQYMVPWSKLCKRPWLHLPWTFFLMVTPASPSPEEKPSISPWWCPSMLWAWILQMALDAVTEIIGNFVESVYFYLKIILYDCMCVKNLYLNK